jgi:periplasmic protein TonB
MFDQLVESTSESKSGRLRNGLLAMSLLSVALIFSGGLLWSLFAKDFGMSGDDLTLSSLVAPVPVPESEPPKPDPVKPEEKKQQTETKDTNIAVRTELIQRADESPKIPDTPSVTQNKVPPRPNGAVKIGNDNFTPTGGSSGPARDDDGGGGGSTTPVRQTKVEPTKPPVEKDDDPPPPPKTPTPTPKPTPTPAPKITGPISGGVVNGKATSLPKPPYPAAAKAVRAAGTVSVQVLIDEDGNVVSASATSGHPLLKAAAVQAARSARFSPTLLSGQKVKVSGIITYNFVAQ